MGIRHFTAMELLTRGASNRNPSSPAYLLNTSPPMAMEANILPTVAIADEIRDEFGSALLVLSAYRSGEYNRAIGGAADSFHRKFRALDLTPTNGEVSRLHRTAEDVMGSRGGVGFYSWGVHIDDRGARARWGEFQT